MSTKEKLLGRFLSLPKDFTYDELVRLFRIFGYHESTKGATSGSRVEFVSGDGTSTFTMHKPHPSGVVKQYALRQILTFLQENTDIERYRRLS